jgi:hypothetical protein
MRLSARVITNFATVNQFSYAAQWAVRAGDPNTLYFQIVDLDQVTLANISGAALIGGFFNVPPAQASVIGLRYMVGVGGGNQPASIQVTFPSIDDAQVINLTAVQADPNDASIWKVTIPPSKTPNSGNVQFAVFEGSNIRRFSVLNMISVEPMNDGSC